MLRVHTNGGVVSDAGGLELLLLLLLSQAMGVGQGSKSITTTEGDKLHQSQSSKVDFASVPRFWSEVLDGARIFDTSYGLVEFDISEIEFNHSPSL
jgi:hypothetical protein